MTRRSFFRTLAAAVATFTLWPRKASALPTVRPDGYKVTFKDVNLLTSDFCWVYITENLGGGRYHGKMLRPITSNVSSLNDYPEVEVIRLGGDLPNKSLQACHVVGDRADGRTVVIATPTDEVLKQIEENTRRLGWASMM